MGHGLTRGDKFASAPLITSSWSLLGLLVVGMLVLPSCSSPGRHESRPTKVSYTPTSERSSSDFRSLDRIASQTGCRVGSDPKGSRHWLSKGGKRVELESRSRVAYIEGELALMKKEPVLRQGKLWVPEAFARKLESWARGPISRNVRPVVAHHVARPVVRRPAPQPRRAGLSGMTFVIDPGHGGKDPGAIAPGSGLREKVVALDVSLQVARFLRASGAQVVMTRDRDEFIPLRERAAISNRYGPVAFVSIHANAATTSRARGIEIFRAMRQEAPTQRESSTLARALYRRLESVSPHGDRGVKPSPGYQVLRYNDFPAALVELGFLTHRNECSMLQDSSYRRRLARAIADGLSDYGQSQRVTAAN